MDPDSWLDFNNRLRVHGNWIEALPYVIFLPPIAGLFFPVPALVGVIMIFVGRLSYSSGYINNNEGARSMGFCVQCVNVLMLFICAFWSAAKVMEAGADLYAIEYETQLRPIADLIEN